MPENKNFRKQFWKNKKMVGSVTPSSRFLTKKIIKNIDFKNSNVFVVLGPGNGVFTKEIIKKMNKNAVLLIFELNDIFYNDLKNRIDDKRVHLIHDSAEKINEYLKKCNVDSVDTVISSLPIAVLPDKVRKKILVSVKRSLNNNGKFIQFQYSLQAKESLKKLYSKIKISFTPFNFPPAFIYTCYK
jgi:phospholipid N-methyltransferase